MSVAAIEKDMILFSNPILADIEGAQEDVQLVMMAL